MIGSVAAFAAPFAAEPDTSALWTWLRDGMARADRCNDDEDEADEEAGDEDEDDDDD